MLKVHHLSDSRSQKVVWLLEELGCPYDLVYHQRLPVTMMGPPELKAAHPIGKAPVLEAEGRSIVESGAIIDYILRRHGQGRLMPDPDGPDLLPYLEWMNFAVSIGSNPIMMKVYARAFGLDGTALGPAADTELALVLGHLDQSLRGKTHLLGDLFTAADIQVSFVVELAKAFASIDAYPEIIAWLGRLHARSGFQASLTKGSYIYGT
jgi:glutathione S-transferase